MGAVLGVPAREEGGASQREEYDIEKPGTGEEDVGDDGRREGNVLVVESAETDDGDG